MPPPPTHTHTTTHLAHRQRPQQVDLQHEPELLQRHILCWHDEPDACIIYKRIYVACGCRHLLLRRRDALLAGVEVERLQDRSGQSGQP
jgi:hypothetical protein